MSSTLLQDEASNFDGALNVAKQNVAKKPGSASDPLWYKDAVIYEVHVKAFSDSNGDGYGDFRGILGRLDYLQQLGVTCLWVLPFFPSPQRDDGYDIADYVNVHPNYGTLADFKEFLDAAHQRGMQVMIELVINHTSDQHPWFQRARLAPPGSPERDMYVWSDTDQKYKATRIIFTDTEKSNWTWDEVAGAYYWHRFFAHQPDLNFDNPRVMEEVLSAMRFWLDMGCDGMRLDAIPYLVERDGTSCENLAETHVIIKAIRAAIDAEYENRLILAEANMWPADVRPYFGDGDECHMAFHFPLMPRIYMALRQEDRLPITEIMAQTPDIPAECQWGLFLRNHDELTLEMVTDDERDYMYFAYSADPRMRINVGIRRRLAPLLDNNRRRIELLNSLLFSFPGTPILYYGDEIGMGDNIYLGDRNGVRTPMQWNSDRNAGFSRAVPAKLYSPVIMDPIWGYQAINVEAQESDTSSLLHWTRNMIALRKLFQVFGRGTLEFLKPDNRKVLAYVREYEGERVVCVANLSRFAQPVTLDLSRWEGMVPVEMLGYVPFPPITKAPYAVTLGPYAFLWLELQPAPVVEAAVSAPELKQEALAVPANDLVSILTGPGLELLQETLLPRHLPTQRWFGAKSRTIRAVTVEDWAELGSPDAALLFLRVEYVEGEAEHYTMPLALRFEDAVATSADKRVQDSPDSLLASVSAERGRAELIDGLLLDEVRQALLRIIEGKDDLATQHGVLRGLPSTAFASLRGSGTLPSHKSSAEQSNSSLLYNERLILKLFRRLQTGENPDAEIGRFLTEVAHFDHIAPFAGEITYTPAGPDSVPATSTGNEAVPIPGDGGPSIVQATPTTGAVSLASTTVLGVLQGFVANEGDGWQWTLRALDTFKKDAAKIGIQPSSSWNAGVSRNLFESEEISKDLLSTGAGYFEAIQLLGERTAEMHLALATPTDDPAFRAEQTTSTALADDRDRLVTQLHATFSTLQQHFATLPDALIEPAARLMGQRSVLLRGAEKIAQLDPSLAGLRTRIHGDYHLGQVLRTANDFILLDFEGEPARSLEERRKKQSPLRDVAGMLRSFSYAAAAGAMADEALRSDWREGWERAAISMFLRGYHSSAERNPDLMPQPQAAETMLRAYLLEKAMYELLYELNNRPDWIAIPLDGIAALL